MLIVRPKSTKRSLSLISFQTRATSKPVTFLMIEFFPAIRFFRLSMYLRTLHQVNAKNTPAAESLQFIMKSTCPGVLTGASYLLGVGIIFEA